MRDKTIRVKRTIEKVGKPWHPWLYKTQLVTPKGSIKPGDVVTVEGADGRFVGRGYYNPKSQISVRLLTFEGEPLDEEFFYKKMKSSVDKRSSLFAKTNAYRAVFSEADGLSGLIVDVYCDTAVFQVLTLGMEKFKTEIVRSIKEVLGPVYIFEKSVSFYRKLEGLKDEVKWWGETGASVIEIFEGKARFLIDIEKGHKTGFYLDQRRSRLAFKDFSMGKKVLDLFCYTGAFSVTCALHGASSVRGIEVKKEWLDLGRKNAILNGVSERIEFMRADAFTALKDIYKSGEKFDIVIIDPPSFLKKKESLVSASKGYREMNLMGMKILTDGGILATFSCSNKMPNELFSNIVKESAKEANKNITILKRCHQDIDHPIIAEIPETDYLKGYFLLLNTII